MNISILDSLGITGDLQGIITGQDGVLNTADVDKPDFSRMLFSHINRIAPDTDMMISNPDKNRLIRIADVSFHNRESADHWLSSEFQQLSELEITISELLGEIAGIIRSHLASEGSGKVEQIVGTLRPRPDEDIRLEAAVKSKNENENHDWQSFEISSDSVFKLASLISRFMENESNSAVISGKDRHNETVELSDSSDSAPDNKVLAGSAVSSRIGDGFQSQEAKEPVTREKPGIPPAIWINMAGNFKAQSFENGKILSGQPQSPDSFLSSNPSNSAPGAIKVEKQTDDGSGEKKPLMPLGSGIWIDFRSQESMPIGSELAVVMDSHSGDFEDIRANIVKPMLSRMPQDMAPRGLSLANPTNQIISDHISADSNPEHRLERYGFMRLSIPLSGGDSLSAAPKQEIELARTISVFVSRSPDHASGLNIPEIAMDGVSSYVSGRNSQKENIMRFPSMQALPQDLIPEMDDSRSVEAKGREIQYEHGSPGTIENESKTSTQVKTSQIDGRIIFIPPGTIEKLLGGSDQVDMTAGNLDTKKNILRTAQSIEDSDYRWQPQPDREMTGSHSGSIDQALRAPGEKDLSKLTPITAGLAEKVLRKSPDSIVAHIPANAIRAVERSEESVAKADLRAAAATQEQETGQIKSNIFVSQESNDREQAFDGRESRPTTKTGSAIDRNQSISFSNSSFKASIDNSPNSPIQTAAAGGTDNPIRVEDIKIAMEQIVRAAKVQIGQGSSQIEVKLKPEYLGMMRIVVKSTEKEVKAVLYIERPEVRQAIEGQIQQLFRSAQEQSIRLDKVEVQEFSTEANSGNHMSSQSSEGEKRKINHEVTEGNVDSRGPFLQQSQSKAMRTHRNFGYNSLELVI